LFHSILDRPRYAGEGIEWFEHFCQYRNQIDVIAR
jgi:hypothetical protein